MPYTNNPIQQDMLPRYEEIEVMHLPKEAMWVAVISQLIFLAFAIVIAIAGRLLNVPLFVNYLLYWSIAVISFVSLMMIWAKISHRYKGFALREHDLIFKRGVIWQKTTILPFNRVQHVETQQGLLQRQFNLTTLNLFTAGGQRADLSIRGMDIKVTDGIKTMLLNRIRTEQDSND